ncbi:MAG TPA: family 16 glycoside hydrolase [Fibrobacteria bacterium]|nr:family 16 glycoside hydrolase [Fibrobacteria bacterium]
MAIFVLAFAAAEPKAQPAFTKADSGWVPLFNGRNFEGIYGRLYSQPVTETPDPSWVILYPGTDTAVIRGSNTSKQGNIGTKKSYSHYRMRVEYRHDVAAGGNNAGITYHTDESKPRMMNNWPFSIECQMMQQESGSAYSIAMLGFNTRANGGTYAPAGGAEVTGCETGCNRRNYNANPIIRGGTTWQEMEIIVRGSDTAWHLVKDQVVLKLWNLRVRTNSGGDGVKVSSGTLGLQAEGALINYRRWEIMELPATGPNYQERLFLTNPDGGTKIAPGSTYTLTWRTLGDVKKVNIQYRIGDGAWQAAANNIDNQGTYAWVVPQQPTQRLRMKISGIADWVRADSSSTDLEITGGTGIARTFIGSWSSEVSESDGNTPWRDFTGRLQGRSAGKAHRILVHRP